MGPPSIGKYEIWRTEEAEDMPGKTGIGGIIMGEQTVFLAENKPLHSGNLCKT